MKCTHCGAELEEDSKFCPECGTPVEDEDDEAVEVPKKKGIFDGVQVSTHLEVGGVLGAILNARKRKKEREEGKR